MFSLLCLWLLFEVFKIANGTDYNLQNIYSRYILRSLLKNISR